jgi:small-conductance mechanosensitive channel
MTIALSAFGVGIGFGLQNIVNNFVCGLILVFEHPIQVGDYVEVGQHSGRVERIGFRSSSVSTGDGGTVIIPNSELIGSKVMNWSLSDQLRRVTLRVPLPVDTNPETVIQMFQAIASNNQEVESFPAPTAALDRFADGSLMFILRCWTSIERYEAVSQSLTLAINIAFREAGIQIPFAQSDVHLHWPDNSNSEVLSAKKSIPIAAAGGIPPKTTAAS